MITQNNILILLTKKTIKIELNKKTADQNQQSNIPYIVPVGLLDIQYIGIWRSGRDLNPRRPCDL